MAGIENGDPNVIVRRVCRDPHDTLAGAGIPGIALQVYLHLKPIISRQIRRGQNAGQIVFELDGLEYALLFQQPPCIADHLCGIELFGLFISGSCIVEQIPHQPVDPPEFLLGALDDAGGFRAVRFVLDQLQVSDDRAERVSQFMGHACGQMADRSQPFGADEFLAGGAELVNGPLQGGDGLPGDVAALAQSQKHVVEIFCQGMNLRRSFDVDHLFIVGVNRI